MDKTFCYFFGNLPGTDKFVMSTKKALRRQASFNGWVTIFAAVTMACLVLSEKQRRDYEEKISKELSEQEEKIADLSEKLEELKQAKGE